MVKIALLAVSLLLLASLVAGNGRSFNQRGVTGRHASRGFSARSGVSHGGKFHGGKFQGGFSRFIGRRKLGPNSGEFDIRSRSSAHHGKTFSRQEEISQPLQIVSVRNSGESINVNGGFNTNDDIGNTASLVSGFIGVGDGGFDDDAVVIRSQIGSLADGDDTFATQGIGGVNSGEIRQQIAVGSKGQLRSHGKGHLGPNSGEFSISGRTGSHKGHSRGFVRSHRRRVVPRHNNGKVNHSGLSRKVIINRGRVGGHRAGGHRGFSHSGPRGQGSRFHG